jgi:shikimate kinase
MPTCRPSEKLNIVLTGFMGTGKTAVAGELSRLLGREVLDADTEIERTAAMPIKEIFRLHGEPYFRDLEAQVIKRLSRRRGVIISTGGGAVLRRDNMEALKAHGVVVCLRASPEVILQRTQGTDERPLLQVEDPLKRIKELLQAREPYYQEADLMIDTDGKTPLQVAQEILEQICRR